MFNMNLNSKPCHIFLTGEKQIGKSTLVDSILSTTDLSWAGIKSITVTKDEKRFIYLADAKNPVVSEAHLIAVCAPSGPEETHPEVFETYGVELVSKVRDVQLFSVDEIGFFENEAPLYRKALLELFERTDLHVIGTYRQDEKAVMYNLMRSHSNIKTFVIKLANRGNMAPVVNRLLHNIHRD